MNRLLLIVLIFFSLSISAQTIEGVVMDDTGEGLIGATIIENGTDNGTVTDIEGRFALDLKTQDAVLTISYTGYSSQEVPVAGQSNINVTLQQGINLGEIQVVGSRSYKRTAVSSPVAVDVIDISELASSNGKVEINQILQYSAPSFNATKQSGSDGADHIDPASLRGLGPDQTLVLVNGKRRHQSSLVNIFGTRGRGNSGTDLNAIPTAAIKRIEILRDGASAQYGSDAIAGVINIVLNDQTEGLTGSVTYGAYSTAVGDGYAEESGETIYNVNGTNRLDGEDKSFDGGSFKADINYGMKLGSKGGFVNFTGELLSKDRTLRPGFSWRKGYGSAAIDGFNFMVNAAVPLSKNTEFFANGGRNFRDTDAYAFSRSSFADGDERAVPSLYPNGFTPRITSNIIDNALTAGVRHQADNGWVATFSHTYGSNYFHYYIKDSNNASMKEASPTTFDAGGHSLGMNLTSFDLSKFYEDIMEGFNVAVGVENRTENFKIFAGEVASYATYDENGLPITNPAIQNPATTIIDGEVKSLPGGSQGFPGYSPANSVDAFRSNFGAFIDTELNVSEAFLASGAVRYENYSDFGSTLTAKLATRYKVMDALSIRASVSSGFRAPSLSQIHYNLLFNNIVAGRSSRTLLAANTSTVTKAFGINSLKEEKALNLGAGITYSKNGFTATIDAYQISVDDRIILTDYFDATSLGIGVEAAQFFANGVDTKTSGIDIVLNYKTQLNDNASLNVGLAGNFNKLDIENIHSGNLNRYTFFSPFSEAYLKAAAPDHKFTLHTGLNFGKLGINIAATKFSQVELQDFQWVDSPPSNKAESDELYSKATDVYKSAYTIDLSLKYDIMKNVSISLGANNLLNAYPTPQYDAWTDQGGFNDSVQMGSDGMYLFGRIGFSF